MTTNHPHLSKSTRWTGPFLAVLVLGVTTGCGSQAAPRTGLQPGPATTNVVSTSTGAGNNVTPATTSANNTANNLNPSNPTNSTVTTSPLTNTTSPSANGVDGSHTPSNTTGTSTGHDANQTLTGTVSVVAPPVLHLNTPVLSGYDTVEVTGTVAHPVAGGMVTVYIENQNHQPVTSARVGIGITGEFRVSFPLDAVPSNTTKFIFGASYPYATSQSLIEYVDVMGTQGGLPLPMWQTNQALQQISGFVMPVPSWLPQQVTTQPQTNPYISTTVFGKSSQKWYELFAAAQPYDTNDPSMGNNDPLLASVLGDTHTDAASALADLNMGMDSLGSTKPVAVNLGINLDASLYSNQNHDVVWQAGGWTFQVQGPSATQNVSEARSLAALTQTISLPAATGRVLLQNIGESSGGSVTPPPTGNTTTNANSNPGGNTTTGNTTMGNTTGYTTDAALAPNSTNPSANSTTSKSSTSGTSAQGASSIQNAIPYADVSYLLPNNLVVRVQTQNNVELALRLAASMVTPTS